MRNIRNTLLLPIMILYELFQEVPGNVRRAAAGGYGTQCWFREIEKFDTIQEAPTSGTVEGQTRIITDTHIFTDGDDGFIKASGHQTGGEVEGKTQGEPGFMGQPQYEFKLFFVGDHPALRERVENLMNRSIILIFKDPNCQDTRMLQLGCDCDPALVSGFDFKSGNRKSGGMKGYEVKVVSSCLFDYEGTLTEKVPSS